MPPSPSTSPLLFEEVNAGGESPRWGVPLIAGAFLNVGAALGFSFSFGIEQAA